MEKYSRINNVLCDKHKYIYYTSLKCYNISAEVFGNISMCI